MASISFLDLMLAEALAAGLARERAQAERPPPDNFFVLPKELRAWRQIQEASRKENMVVCLEITRRGNENCARVQKIYMDMAREYENIPFVRVFIEQPFATFDELRKDVGGVQYTPTILVLFYDADDSIARAKYEGFDEIMVGLRTGRIEGVIKELLGRRAKLKLVEGLIAQHLRNKVSENERRVREEYEKEFIRKMETKNKEKEREEEERKKEEEKKQEEEKKKKEEEEELERRRKEAREAEEKLIRERPKHIQDLLAMDLEQAGAGQLKKMMKNLGISTAGCVEKQDLKKKLVENVPELRIKVGDKTPGSGSQPTSSYRKHDESTDRSSSYNTGSMGSTGSSEMDRLRKENMKLRDQLEQADQSIRALKKENSDLRSGAKNSQSATDGRNMLVKNLEERLRVTRMLYTTSLDSFSEEGVIHTPIEDGPADSLILRVKCTKPGFPHKDKTYAMKVLANYFKTQTQTQVRQEYQNEYEALCRLPSHENIIHMWAFFYDHCDPTILKHLKKLKENSKTMSLFILMDEHPNNMADYLENLVSSRGPNPSKVIRWIRDLLKGLVFLQDHKVVHRDLKMENLLLNENGSLVISDFGKSLIMEDDCDDFKIRHSSGFDVGGNDAHLAPEIVNSKPGGRRYLDYFKQPVWAAGVLAYELAGHKNPFQDMQFCQKSYTIREVPSLEKTFCVLPIHRQSLPRKLTDMVRTMIDPDQDNRPTLQRCLNMIETIV